MAVVGLRSELSGADTRAVELRDNSIPLAISFSPSPDVEPQGQPWPSPEACQEEAPTLSKLKYRVCLQSGECGLHSSIRRY